MSEPRTVLCGSATAGNHSDPRPVRLHLWGPRQNVNLKISDVREAMYQDVPPVFLDLIEIAAYVYTADQAIRRPDKVIGRGDEPEIGDGWRRSFHLRIPVREPAKWASPAVLKPLIETLSFLSDDEYRFEFEPLKEKPPLQRYLDFVGSPFDGIVDEVVLFSGGLDSVAGAVHESMVERRKVLLVHHRSNEKLARRHRHLLELLRGHAGDRSPLLFPVRINKSKGLGRESTQRSRSFLYASVAATIAKMIGRFRVRFYENGVVGLNLPPSPQVVGGRATRTTHPIVLTGLSKLLTVLAGKPFTVENPFLWKTKTDIVRLIAEAGCGDLIRYTNSCVDTRGMTKQHTHSGTCSQCVDRRFAILASGQQEKDPGEAYKSDLLVGRREVGYARTMIASYVAMAKDVRGMSVTEFFGRFGEAARAIRQVGGSSETATINIYDLYRRHAKEVTAVVEAALGQHASQIFAGTLDPTCLIRLVCESGVNEPQIECPKGEAARLPSANYFRKNGRAWVVRYGDEPERILMPSKGVAYIHQLIANPGVPLKAVDLACRVTRNPADFLLGNPGDLMGQQEMAALRVKVEELRKDIDRARKNHDDAALQSLELDKEQICAEIRRATGHRGRIRQFDGDEERARKSVYIAIKRAVDDIHEIDPRLAGHFRSPRIRCGKEPCYFPDSDVTWET